MYEIRVLLSSMRVIGLVSCFSSLSFEQEQSSGTAKAIDKSFSNAFMMQCYLEVSIFDTISASSFSIIIKFFTKYRSLVSSRAAKDFLAFSLM